MAVALALLTGCFQSLVRFDAGASAPACDGGTTGCGGACVDTLYDDPNCGACAAACTATQSCAAGNCLADDCPGADCGPTQGCASGACIDLRCVGVACATGQICNRGQCQPDSCGAIACAPGNGCVGGICTDVRCEGVVCAGTGRVCRLGRCEDPADGGCPGVADAGLGRDVDNCGACGSVCPLPANAPRACSQGQCGRGACLPGFFDFEPGVFGCETACVVTRCTRSDAGILDLTDAPVPESGLAWQTAASGGAYGSAIQTSADYTNHATLGQPTPTGSVEQSNATHKNIGGFESMLRK